MLKLKEKERAVLNARRAKGRKRLGV